MAQKRMFDRTITNDDDFMELSSQAQSLYFQMNMSADDDGLTKNYRNYMKLLGATDDDLQALIDKSFIIKFESGVIAIKHWLIHNTVRKDRYRKTIFQDEYNKLAISENNEYVMVKEDGLPTGNQLATQYSIAKYSIGEQSADESSSGELSLVNSSKEKNSSVEEREEVEILSKDDFLRKEIIDYLNKKVNANYDYNDPKTKELIQNLIDRGKRKLDFQVVIDKKYNEWHNNKMSVQLNPYILFGEKFDMYFNQPPAPMTTDDISMSDIDRLIAEAEERKNNEEEDNEDDIFGVF